MTTSFFDDPTVLNAVAEVKRSCQGKEFSDIIDGDHQYVDFVMEGGGVLGIALVGYTYVLEQAGLRFLGIAGTSAGSINALMLAALGPPAQEKSKDLVKILADMPMHEFIDGDSDARDFCRAVLEKARIPKLLLKAAQIKDNLEDDLGLNPGKAFLGWLTDELKQLGISTTKHLLDRINTPPEGIKIRPRTEEVGSSPDLNGKLIMIAADITTETKVEFPDMAQLYWTNYLDVPPADYARASMSIPFFFHPYKVTNIPQNPALWIARGKDKTIKLPQDVLFMDGGIMSNFPINVFHQPYEIPTAPTFGVKIGVDGAYREITKPSQLLGAVFDTARHTLDEDFIAKNPDYRLLVKQIDTGPHHWLNFGMRETEKVDLFARGAQAAAEFLCNFDWRKYKEVRAGIAKASKESRAAKSKP
jgi:NTE family protein